MPPEDSIRARRSSPPSRSARAGGWGRVEGTTVKQTIQTFSFLLFMLHCMVPAHADTSPLWGDLRPGTHDVGFRLIEKHDPARAIRVKGAVPEIRSRPVRVYMWYPANSSADDTHMPFGRYAALAWPLRQRKQSAPTVSKTILFILPSF